MHKTERDPVPSTPPLASNGTAAGPTTSDGDAAAPLAAGSGHVLQPSETHCWSALAATLDYDRASDASPTPQGAADAVDSKAVPAAAAADAGDSEAPPGANRSGAGDSEVPPAAVAAGVALPRLVIPQIVVAAEDTQVSPLISAEDMQASPHRRRWVASRETALELACLVQESGMPECFAEAAGDEDASYPASPFCTEETYARDCGQRAAVREPASNPSLMPGLLSFHKRLLRAAPAANVTSRVDWSRLAAVETIDALTESSPSSPRKDGRQSFDVVQVNTGGQVFFALLRPEDGFDNVQEEACVIKFCNSRHMLQSEQMAAELAWHLGIEAPASRLLLKVHDSEEWWELAAAADAHGAERLCEKLQKKQSMLLLQFAPGSHLGKEHEAWSPENVTASSHALGRLLVLDLLLGNADRLPMRPLSWRGNPTNVLWSSHPGIGCIAGEAGAGRRCIPIDAVVARRPPRAMVEHVDQQAGKLLEMALLDRASAQQAMLEAVSCNSVAKVALQADWAPNEKAWAAKRFRTSAASAPHSAVKAFHEGLRAALELALRERGFLEMVVTVLRGWLDAFHEDMGNLVQPKRPLTTTQRLANLQKKADKNEDVKERMCFWQELLQQKSMALRQAADDWASQRGLETVQSFRGFLGDSVINPVADAYELLVRLEQLVARAKVLADAALGTRPSALDPTPLFVGPVTASCCLHLLRKLGVTAIINCTMDLPEPDSELLAAAPGIAWHRLALADVEDQDLASAFEEGLRIIDGAVASSGKVLIHCHEGRSRSVSLCLAYMVLRERKPLGQALHFVKSKRPQARPNAGFMRQLLALEFDALGSNSVSPEDMPRGKPQGFVCEICGEGPFPSAEALVLHMKHKHPDAAAT